MQGVAAHDLIEHEDLYLGKHEARAAMVSSPRARLEARPVEPEAHGPSVTERELGEQLHPDRNAQHGHPGRSCRDLPAGHAHRKPACDTAREVQRPQEAEAPLLVDVTAEGGAKEEEESGQ